MHKQIHEMPHSCHVKRYVTGELNTFGLVKTFILNIINFPVNDGIQFDNCNKCYHDVCYKPLSRCLCEACYSASLCGF